MLPSLRALVFPMAQCSTSSAQNCKRLRSYIQHNCALPDADDLALRAQDFKIADLPMLHISFTSTKTPILCSKSPKTGVPEGKKAQKPRFCARKAQKWGSRRPRKHKNPDFVLEMPENDGSEGQKRTQTPILCSKSPKTGGPDGKSAQKHRFCAREEGELASGNSEMASGIVKVAFLQITAHASKTQISHNQTISF